MNKNCSICGDAPVSDESSEGLCEPCQGDLDNYLGLDLSEDYILSDNLETFIKEVTNE